MFSIDQNCHSLWDVLPKLQALAARKLPVVHFVEDVDMAYTAIGATDDEPPRLARERYHRSGGADWGAAVFYFEFLGRQPVEIRDWERYTGLKTNVLARRLDRSVDNLYDEFSPSDNWQMIGPSYVGDRDHHRLLGDLTVAETAPLLWEMMDKARADMARAFPAGESQQRLDQWFEQERRRLEDLVETCAAGRLPELYAGWLEAYVGEPVRLDRSSNLFATGADPDRTALLELFLRDYDLAAGLYNEAIAETSSELRPLKTSEGELPFFATLSHNERMVRTGVFLDGASIRIGRRSFPLAPEQRLPLDKLADGGIRCLPGKAMLLAIQVRLGSGGAPLALPHKGSLYMHTAVRLAEKLSSAGLLPGQLHPIVRVRLRLLDRMRETQTPIRLPEYLAAAFGSEEIPASQLGANWEDVQESATRALASFETDEGRRRWREQNCADIEARIDALDVRRRELARQKPPPAEEIRPVSRQIKELEVEILDRMLRQVAIDYHVSKLDYWDSRGAPLPWSIALGGRAFYDSLIAQADIREEAGTES